MVAEDLIPGNLLVEPCRFVRFLIIDAARSEMSAGTGSNDLAVNDIDVPPEFFV